jgi:hypothetical protein
VDTALDALAGPDGLTGQVSTFTRTDVVDALAKRLPVAPSAQEALTQVEAAADQFLQERAVRVGRDGRLGVDCYSTPELLALERQLVDGATSRAEQGCALVRPEVVRHLTQGGAGVAVVVGRAGSGKTWALGLAREAFELDGYQVLGTAPTGIATVALADEGFTDARTVDRLLLDLQHRRTELDDRTVLVVDEAAMVTTRSSLPSLCMRSGRVPRWRWSATTGSSPPSRPAAASAPSASGWAPANSPSIAGRSRPGSSAPLMTCALATSSRRSPPMPSTTVFAPMRPAMTVGVVNGTTAVIQDLDLHGRAMTVRTLEEEPPNTVRLPGWYLDAAVRPGQSRRVDLAYARTDMRSQGRTERRALLALDGAEDMQGGYVQLTRSTQRTDLYLTVGPEPLGPDDQRG